MPRENRYAAFQDAREAKEIYPPDRTVACPKYDVKLIIGDLNAQIGK